MNRHDLIEIAARTAHEVNRTYCRSLGDKSQKSWDECDMWQKDSCYAGVEKIMANQHISPDELHDAWVEHKLREGWVYGAEKCPDAKTHPCIVAYDNLPVEQRLKDELFRTVVLSVFEQGR